MPRGTSLRVLLFLVGLSVFSWAQPDSTLQLPNPVDTFREQLKKDLRAAITPQYPNAPEFRDEFAAKPDTKVEDAVFDFLDSAERAPADQKPAMLLAADFMLLGLQCPEEQKSYCERLKLRFASYKLSLTYIELGGGYFYGREILWRVWREFPDSPWGEKAFLLLLDSGWSTKGACADGSDLFRSVIREGEKFLEQKPKSALRPYVLHEVGVAYATWWSLSLPDKDIETYLEAKDYEQGAEEARLKAIDYFEQVERAAPKSELADYSSDLLPDLRVRRSAKADGYKHFCIYD